MMFHNRSFLAGVSILALAGCAGTDHEFKSASTSQLVAAQPVTDTPPTDEASQLMAEPQLREQVTDLALDAVSAASADRGAALCVRAYAELAHPNGVTERTLAAIDDYCGRPASNPHAARWHISLRYVQGVAALQLGDRPGAVRALTACAEADPLVFSGLLATKTVSACWLTSHPASSIGSSNFSPKPGCFRNLLSSIDHTRPRILSRAPLTRCGSSTRSTSTTMPEKPNALSRP